MEENPDIKCDLSVTNNSHPPKDSTKNKRMKGSESNKQNLMNDSSKEKLAKKNNEMDWINGTLEMFVKNNDNNLQRQNKAKRSPA